MLFKEMELISKRFLPKVTGRKLNYPNLLCVQVCTWFRFFSFSCWFWLQTVKFCTYPITPQILLLVVNENAAQTWISQCFWRFFRCCAGLEFKNPEIMVGSLIGVSPASTCWKRTAFCSASRILWLPGKSIRNPGVISWCTKHWRWHCHMCTYTHKVSLLTAFVMLCCSLLVSHTLGTPALVCARMCELTADYSLPMLCFMKGGKQKTRQLLTMTENV